MPLRLPAVALPALNDEEADCVDLSACTQIIQANSAQQSQEARVGGRKRKHSDSASDRLLGEEGVQEGPEVQDQEEGVFFFRVSHTQLGWHRFFDKGVVATHDIGLQTIPLVNMDNSTATPGGSESRVTEATRV